MVDPVRFSVREIELYERPVVLRLPFRFGVVTLTQCPQAFARARIEFADGASAWGAAAEMMAPKWFDKNLQLSNEDNFEQLCDVLLLARQAYLSDGAKATAFGHFARHYDEHLAAARAKGYNPLLAGYGPALLDRAVLDALCRGRGASFYAAMQSNLPGIGGERPEFAGFDFERFLGGLAPAADIEARHTVGMLDAITATDLTQRVGDGLPETLAEVVQAYGHRYFKLKVGGNLAADLARLDAIAVMLDQLREAYFVSLDGNEQYEHAEGVAELVAAIRGRPVGFHTVHRAADRAQAGTGHRYARRRPGQAGDHRRIGCELDTFVQARARGYAGVSSKTCKGLYKSILNAARCASWNAQEGAQVNLLGIRHVERNGHHYVNGMAAQSPAEQESFLAAHPDVYERSHGAVRLKIRRGRIAIESLACTGYASAAMPDFGAMSRTA